MSDEPTDVEVLPAPPMQPQPPELPHPAERDGGAIEVPHGAALSRFSEAQRRCLRQPIPLEEIEILPSGELYATQVRYRRILCDAFGPGGWAVVPLSPYCRAGNTLVREYALYVNGKYVGQAMGEADYHANSRQSWGTVAESLKSDAVKRTCKDLCVASELWDPNFCRVFQEEHCVRVVVLVEDRGRPQKKVMWRRKDGKPLKGECGLAEDIPRGGIVQQPRALAEPEGEPLPLSDEEQAELDRQAAAEEAGGAERFITRPQQIRLFAIARDGVGEQQLRAHLQAKYHLHSTSRIPVGLYDELCLWAAARGANG